MSGEVWLVVVAILVAGIAPTAMLVVLRRMSGRYRDE